MQKQVQFAQCHGTYFYWPQINIREYVDPWLGRQTQYVPVLVILYNEPKKI